MIVYYLDNKVKIFQFTYWLAWTIWFIP